MRNYLYFFIVMACTTLTVSSTTTPPIEINVTCRYGTHDCSIKFESTEYPNPNAGDSAIIVDTLCGSSTSATNKFGHVTVDTNTTPGYPTFTFTGQASSSVGNFYVCWCDESDNSKDCSSDPTDADEMNNNFPQLISSLLRAPPVIPMIDCSTEYCTASVTYTVATQVDIT
eukprot:GHVL01030412.1.p1 GENE.GHVL01030412.1~~GHVL01030412.1.p1  ORF type:complete len:190 (+),score=19.11 GHVL01030412.1:59-571(+)